MSLRPLSAALTLALAAGMTGCSLCHHDRTCAAPAVVSSAPVPVAPVPAAPAPCGCNTPAPGLAGPTAAYSVPPPPVPVPGH
jgi:hypothetical protein